MTSKLDDTIALCNELKGLLLLVKSGEEADNENILHQVANKATQMAELIVQIKTIKSSENTIKTEFVLNEDVHKTESSTIEMDINSESPEIPNQESHEITPKLEADGEDNIFIEEPTAFVKNDIANASTDAEQEVRVELSDDTDENESPTTIDVTTEIYTDNNTSDEDQKSELPELKSPITIDIMLAQQNSKDLKKAFTINDRFRFKRELFGNSDNDFVDAINLVSAMQSLTEAEEYFYEDLGWDSESEEVQEFMSIIINHFS